MKIIIKVEESDTEKEVDMEITDENLNLDWFEISVDRRTYSIPGKELEAFCRAFLANRQSPKNDD